MTSTTLQVKVGAFAHKDGKPAMPCGVVPVSPAEKEASLHLDRFIAQLQKHGYDVYEAFDADEFPQLGLAPLVEFFTAEGAPTDLNPKTQKAAPKTKVRGQQRMKHAN